MLKSMTGFGSGRAAVSEEDLAVEVRSVNHKFCEVKVRLPRELSSLEPALQKLVKDRLARGAVDVAVKRQGGAAGGTVPTVDLALAREYHRAFSEIAKALSIENTLTNRDIGVSPGVIKLEEPGVNLEASTEACIAALNQALDAIVGMRKVEGQALYEDLSARISLVSTMAGEISQLAPRAVDEHQARLKDRVAELSKGLAVDPQRLAQEVAFFAERTDVAEEMTRLASHIEQFRSLLSAPEPTGRKMDFLAQEMHREVNTTGAKSQHPEISKRVMAMKAEVERIKEQVQNVE